jgi:hypothetical protein
VAGNNRDDNRGGASRPSDTTAAATPPTSAATPAIDATADALRAEIADLGRRLAASERIAAERAAELEAMGSRLNGAAAERDDLARRFKASDELAESQMRELEAMGTRLRAAEAAATPGARLADAVRALGASVGLDHLPTPGDILDALRPRLAVLRDLPGSGLRGVKRFQAHGMFVGRSGKTIVLSPGDEIPEDLDASQLDPRLVTVG